MGGQDSTPIVPSKTHARFAGRGGVGNIEEAKKWDEVAAPETPLKVESVV